MKVYIPADKIHPSAGAVMQRVIYQPTSSALPERFGLEAYSVLDRLHRRQL